MCYERQEHMTLAYKSFHEPLLNTQLLCGKEQNTGEENRHSPVYRQKLYIPRGKQIRKNAKQFYTANCRELLTRPMTVLKDAPNERLHGLILLCFLTEITRPLVFYNSSVAP